MTRVDADGGGAETMGLADLAEAAGVSIRTIRYYIAEGLLPPPDGAGPRAAYRREHLDRLRLVGRLKAAYLPLREIRRRLRGLDAAAVRDLLTDAPPAVSTPSDSSPDRVRTDTRVGATEGDRDGVAVNPEKSGDDRISGIAGRPTTFREDDGSAAAYLARLLPPRAPSPRPPMSPTRPSRSAGAPKPGSPRQPVRFPPRPPEELSVADAPAPAPVPASAAELTRADLDRGATLAALAALATVDSGPNSASALEAEPWRRLSLGPDAELLIRADAYTRQREQVDAIVAWARRVLG